MSTSTRQHKPQKQILIPQELPKRIQRNLKRNAKLKKINEAPEAPLLLSLSQLERKTGIPYKTLKSLLECGLPCIRTKGMYLISYPVFLDFVSGKPLTENIKH